MITGSQAHRTCTRQSSSAVTSAAVNTAHQTAAGTLVVDTGTPSMQPGSSLCALGAATAAVLRLVLNASLSVCYCVCVSLRVNLLSSASSLRLLLSL